MACHDTFHVLELKTVMLHEKIFELSKKYGPAMTIYFGKLFFS